MQQNENNSANLETETKNEPIITYSEHKIGKTLYRVTNIHKGEIDLAKALEDLIVKRILYGKNEL